MNMKHIIIVLTIFLLHCCYNITGVMISPPGMAAPVCSGDQLELTCTTAGRFLEWSFFLIPEGDTTARRYSRVLNSNSPTSELEVNTITFMFSIISAGRSLLLTSRLIISPVRDSLNGTEVNCTDVGTSNSTSTIITVFNNNSYYAFELKGVITVLSEQFERDGVIVTLGIEENTLYESYVSANPQLISDSVISIIDRATFQIKILYNIMYNVSVVAAHLCGRNNVTTFIDLYYTKCENPADQIDSSLVKVIGYRDPAREGTNVTLVCSMTSSRPILTETNLSTFTCTGNGEWEPDPREFNCSDNIMMMVSTTLTTTSRELDNSSYSTVLGIAIGVTLLILLLLLLSATVIVILAKAKLRGSTDNRKLCHDYHSERYFNMTKESSCNATAEVELTTREDHKIATSGLIYVDIGQSSFNQKLHHMTSTHDLDDNGIEYAQLNYRLLNTRSQKTHDHVKPAVTTYNNVQSNKDSFCVTLDNLLIQLRPQVTTKWFQFGEAIGVEREVLDNCVKTCSPEDCIVEMLDYWLRHSTEKPTWKDISEALKAINLSQLAHDIEEVYLIGKLPVEVDVNWIPQLQESVELPPPIPPKSSTFGILQSAPHNESLAKSGTATKSPALPPKLINKGRV